VVNHTAHPTAMISNVKDLAMILLTNMVKTELKENVPE